MSGRDGPSPRELFKAPGFAGKILSVGAPGLDQQRVQRGASLRKSLFYAELGMMGFEGTDWLIIGAAWFLGTFGGGWILAWLYKRLHPQLAFYKLWAFWSAILGGVVALLFALGAVRM